MKPLILMPQFVDRGGNVVYNIHQDDPDCRILRAGKLLAQVRFNPEDGFKGFEIVVPKEEKK